MNVNELKKSHFTPYQTIHTLELKYDLTQLIIKNSKSTGPYRSTAMRKVQVNKILSFNKELISRPTKVGPVNVLSLIHIETY
jgi:hypothetical protein